MIRQPDVDSHKLMYHPNRVTEWLEKRDCYPIYVEIGLTSRCNHRCVFCALDWVEKNKSDIDSKVMINTLKDMVEHEVKSVMFAGEGEPLLHKDISKFVQYPKEKGMDFSITTNGIMFTEKKAEEILPYLSWIRFSVDAGTRRSYAKIHKTQEGDFDKVLKNIKRAVEIRNKRNLEITIGVQYLLIPQNVNEVIKLAETCRDIGADNLQIKPYSQHPDSINRFVIDYKDYKHLETQLERFNSGNPERFRIVLRKQTIQRLQEIPAQYNECYALPFFALIDTKGNVIPCNLFYDNQEFTYGNLYKQSFSEIWASEKRKKVIEKLKNKGIDKCRKGCRLDPVNRYLHRLKNPHPHDNFI